MSRWRSVVLALVLASSASVAGAADDAADAAARFQEGRSKYAAGRYEEAAKLFEQANALAPHPATLFNAATAWDQAGDSARAADAYQGALEGELDAESLDTAKKRLDELAPRLGVLEVSAPAGAEVTVDERVRRKFPARIYVLPGVKSVRCALPDGRWFKKEFEVGAGQREIIELTPPEAPQRRVEPPPSTDSSGAWTVAGWVGVGLSAGLAVTSALVWQKAKSERDDLIAGDASARGRAQTLQTWTNVTLVSSIALGAAGVTVLVLRPGRAKETGALRLRVGSGVSLSGSF
jgi:hypothetical protein